MPPTAETHGAQLAKQPRSQETLELLLQAAEELIEERDYAKVSMNDIAERAGRAVGSLYSRVGSKKELMFCLFHRYLCSTEVMVDNFVNSRDWRGVALRSRIEAVVGLLIDNYVRRRGMVRALNIHRMPASTEARYRPRLTTVFNRLTGLLSEDTDDLSAAPAAGAEFGLLFVIAAARSRIVDGADSGITRIVDTRDLKQELSWILWLYLTAGPASAAKGHGPSSG